MPWAMQNPQRNACLNASRRDQRLQLRLLCVRQPWRAARAATRLQAVATAAEFWILAASLQSEVQIERALRG
jgi:hypothetical protein